MDLTRTLDVLVICAPVFALIGLGKLLERKGRLTDGPCAFINWLVYHFSLPALIFNAVARQRMTGFFDPAVIVMPLVALVAVALVSMLIAKLAGLKGGIAAAFVFGTFWANATYIGIPLCTNAFGESGEAKAAIYNAFVLPFFILIGYLLIGFYGDGSGRTQIRARMKKAFLNPILLSAFAGILAALIADPFRAETGPMLLPAIVVSAASLFGSFLKMIGSMGLPLALLSIGASLKWDNSGSRWMALLWTVGCKLVLLPLTTLLLVVWLLPSADRVSTGVAVILAGTPMSVAGYVISCQLGIERSFVAAMLVISTLLSVLTIPVWVYVVMGL